ncbi:MAG: PAS domain S-box protein [Prolixibacteraceae bacterium]|nr:PAS domain S-box protein [Prolixibacteraceae bacterium]
MVDKKPTNQQMQKQLEEFQGVRNEKFREMLRNSFDIIVLLDDKGIQHYVSESCEKILGYRPEELTGIPVIEQMIHPDDQLKTLEGFREILNKNAHGGTQYRHRHKDGGWVYLEAYGNNQLDNPNIRSVILNVREITDRKKAEEALKKSEAQLAELNATKDMFFSIIAHDLKSPFNSILGLSELLIERIGNKNYSEIETFASLIKTSSQRTLDLLTNLLEWSMAQTGRIQFNPDFVDLSKLVVTVLDLLDHSAKQKSVSIKNEVPGNFMVWADKNMLKTILRNLISNGIKFTNTGGEIIIGAQKNNDKKLVSVTDNGIGMKPETVKKLFRIDHSHSTRGTEDESGTGLGLLLCQEFIEFHNGTITAESTPGKGTTFFLTLPERNTP